MIGYAFIVAAVLINLAAYAPIPLAILMWAIGLFFAIGGVVVTISDLNLKRKTVSRNWPKRKRRL